MVTLAIDNFCRLSKYFWSVYMKFSMMVAILVEFNVSWNVVGGHLNARVRPYVYRIPLQDSTRIAIHANRHLLYMSIKWSAPSVSCCCFNSVEISCPVGLECKTKNYLSAFAEFWALDTETYAVLTSSVKKRFSFFILIFLFLPLNVANPRHKLYN